MTRERPLFIVETPQIQRYRSITSTAEIKSVTGTEQRL
ncbi:hypothetical protein V6Z12_D07G114600 [Gossypium hirsutum]